LFDNKQNDATVEFETKTSEPLYRGGDEMEDEPEQWRPCGLGAEEERPHKS